MTYKTLMLQIYKPSGQKRSLIDSAILHYSQALQALLDKYREEIGALSESQTNITQRLLLNLIDKETSSRLNDFDAQPFKDSLKIEFAEIAAAFIAQRRKNNRAGYPSVYVDSIYYHSSISGLIKQFDNGLIGRKRFEYVYSKLILKVDRLRSLYFGRYSTRRDYCLLYDEFKDRFYAKLYLTNFAEGIIGGDTVSGLSLKYVTAGMPDMLNQIGKKRYIVVPLAFGRNQYNDLKKTLNKPEILHTAHLLKKENKYYLMVNMECESEPVLTTSTTLGISRNATDGLNYTICDDNGFVLKNGQISSESNQKQLTFALSKEILKIASDNRSQVVLESNGGINDDVLFKKGAGTHSIAAKQYMSLANILKYKLPEKRLPPPIEVSVNGLFCTCPICENRTHRNIVSDEIFACVECGYASESEWIGSENLSKRLIQYRLDKVPIYVSKSKKDNSLTFYNKNLGFEYVLPQGVTDYTQMYYELNLFVQGMDGTFENNSRKYSILEKLRQSPHIMDAVRIVFKRLQN